MAVKLGFKKIVVAPYFLFGGRLIDRIYAYVDKIAKEQPEIEFLKADYLRDQSHVIDTFALRINEAINSEEKTGGLMACFKERLARGEINIHHHHAEFQADPEDDETGSHEHHEHAHDHNHGHSHGHHHAPYKHIGHPHGPRTMIDENVCCCFMGQFPQHIIDEEKSNKSKLSGTPACKQ